MTKISIQEDKSRAPAQLGNLALGSHFVMDDWGLCCLVRLGSGFIVEDPRFIVEDPTRNLPVFRFSDAVVLTAPPSEMVVPVSSLDISFHHEVVKR